MMVRKRGRNTRERILAVARDLFSTYGFEATTVRRIGATLGISDAAIYHHFSSKREIYEAALDTPSAARQQFAEFIGSLDELVEEVAAHQELWSSVPHLSGILLVGSLEANETTGEISRALAANYRQQFERVLSHTSVGDVEMTAEAVSFLITGASIGALLDHPGEDDVETRNRCFKEVVHRLLPVLVPEHAFTGAGVRDAG